MAVVADRVIVELEARLDRYEANVRRAEQKFDVASRNVQRSAKALEDSVRRSTDAAGNSLRGLASTFAAAFTADKVREFADSYTRFTNQLKVAGVEGENLARVQSNLFAIGQQYGVQLEGLGTLYSRGSQVSKELGASQEQLIRFTEGVAAALKIQGTSAAESQGALLQLSQLLASGTVRAEEFNSVNEGALPILQAVARNIDGAGGSVGKLKMLVNDGKVSSRQFFQAFLEGSEQLKTQAASAGTTIAQSFTILQNALTAYIGQADASLGVTERVNAALVALSQNLDTVATALGILGAVLLGRVVSGMVAAAASTGVASAAIFALQARAVGAATTMEALAFAGATAGRTLLAAFGGPVGIAVAALSVGLGYLATSSYEASSAADALQASISSQASEFAHLEKRQAQAAAEANNLTSEQRNVLTATAGLTGEVNLLATAWGRVAAQAKAAAVEQARASYAKATSNVIESGQAYFAKREQVFRAQPRPFAERGLGRDLLPTDPQGALRAAEAGSKDERARFDQARRNRQLARQNLEQIEKTPLAEYKVAPPAPPAGKPTKPKKDAKPKGRSGPSPDEIARRFEDDLARGNVELRMAQADAIGTAQARRDAEKFRIEQDRLAANRQTEGDKNLSAAQKAELVALNDKVAAARQDALIAEQRVDDAADALSLAQGDLQNQRDLLDAQAQLANTATEKRDIELRIVRLQYQEERLRLEAIANNERLNAAEREIARRRLAMLPDLQKADEANVERRNEGAGQRYLRELKGADINEQLDEVRVRGLQRLEDKLVDVTSKIFKMGGAFGDVANQIISDLIRIGVQRAIIEPLADALFGAGKSGGAGGAGGGGIAGVVGTFVKGLFGGRASGGHVNAGQVYRVTDGEGFQPAGSGKIIPLGQMNKAQSVVAGGSSDTYLNVSVSAPGANAQTVALIKQTIADAAPTIVQAAQRVTTRNLSRKRMT